VAAIPLAIGALIAAVGLLIEDFYRWSQGQESVIGDALENFPMIEKMLIAIGDAIQLAWDVFTGFFEWMGSTLWSSLPDMITSWITSIDDFAAYVWQKLTGAFEGIWSEMKRMFFEEIEIITSQISSLVKAIGGYADSIPGVSSSSFQNLADQLNQISDMASGEGVGAQGATTAAQQQIFEQQQQANYRMAPSFYITQRPGEDGRTFADRVSQNQKEELEREKRQTADFFSGGVSY